MCNLLLKSLRKKASTEHGRNIFIEFYLCKDILIIIKFKFIPDLIHLFLNIEITCVILKEMCFNFYLKVTGCLSACSVGSRYLGLLWFFLLFIAMLGRVSQPSQEKSSLEQSFHLKINLTFYLKIIIENGSLRDEVDCFNCT